MTSLRSVDDLLAVVPYLLGFHPADSAVVLGVRDDRIIFQARGDLPAPADVPRLARYYADLVARQHPTGALVVGYGDGAAVTPIVCALGAAMDARGIRLLDAVRVADGRLPARGPQLRPADQPGRPGGHRRRKHRAAVPGGTGAAAGSGRRAGPGSHGRGDPARQRPAQ